MAAYHTFNIGKFPYELFNVTNESKNKDEMAHLSDNAEMFELRRLDPITAEYHYTASLIGDVPNYQPHPIKCNYFFSATNTNITDSADGIAIEFAKHYLNEERYKIFSLV